MSNDANIQGEIEHLGRRIFELIDQEQGSSGLFTRRDFYSRLMEWSMSDPLFKTQMFRFVDVLPALRSSDEVVEHLSEYLNDTKSSVSAFLQGALRVGRFVPPISAAIIRKNIAGMANIFITGTDGASALPNLGKIWSEGARFTVDILGEAVVGAREADDFAAQGALQDKFNADPEGMALATSVNTTAGPLAGWYRGALYVDVPL